MLPGNNKCKMWPELIALNLVRHFRHAPLCFPLLFNMYEVSNATVKTVINRHTLIFIFNFNRPFCTCMKEVCWDCEHDRLKKLYSDLGWEDKALHWMSITRRNVHQ